MPCVMPFESRLVLNSIPQPLINDPKPIGGTPFLCYSDNPESLVAANINPNSGILWTHTVSNNPTQKHRIYLWHENHLSYDLEFAVELVTRSTWTDINVASKYCYNINAAGHEFPYDLLIGQEGKPNQISSGSNIIGGPWTVLIGQFIGVQMILRNVPTNSLYTLRVLYRKKNSGVAWSTITGCPPTTANSPHPRGSWAYSETIQKYTLLSGPTSCAIYNLIKKPQPFGRVDSSKLEICGNMCGENGSACAVDNPGPYGAVVNLEIEIPAICKNKQYHIYLIPRGGDVQGALSIKSSGQTSVESVPLMSTEEISGKPPKKNFYSFLSRRIIYGVDKTVQLRWAIGGGGNAPVWVYFFPFS